MDIDWHDAVEIQKSNLNENYFNAGALRLGDTATNGSFSGKFVLSEQPMMWTLAFEVIPPFVSGMGAVSAEIKINDVSIGYFANDVRTYVTYTTPSPVIDIKCEVVFISSVTSLYLHMTVAQLSIVAAVGSGTGIDEASKSVTWQHSGMVQDLPNAASSGTQFGIGDHKITYTVEDYAGNVGEYYFTITVFSEYDILGSLKKGVNSTGICKVVVKNTGHSNLQTRFACALYQDYDDASGGGLSNVVAGDWIESSPPSDGEQWEIVDDPEFLSGVPKIIIIKSLAVNEEIEFTLKNIEEGMYFAIDSIQYPFFGLAGIVEKFETNNFVELLRNSYEPEEPRSWDLSGDDAYAIIYPAWGPYASVNFPTSQITISIWAYRDIWDIHNADGWKQLVSSYGSFNQGTYQKGGWQIGISNKRIHAKIVTVDADGDDTEHTVYPAYNKLDEMRSTQWHHIAFTYDGYQAKLYINGELTVPAADATGPQPDPQPENPSDIKYWRSPDENGNNRNAYFIIGGRWTQYNQEIEPLTRWDGYINEVAIFDTALTQERLRFLFGGDAVEGTDVYAPRDASENIQVMDLSGEDNLWGLWRASTHYSETGGGGGVGVGSGLTDEAPGERNELPNGEKYTKLPFT
ncbi:HYR domain-containing protein, partial [bacterium]|nr:HYR domain-containing protein [bacterium]